MCQHTVSGNGHSNRNGFRHLCSSCPEPSLDVSMATEEWGGGACGGGGGWGVKGELRDAGAGFWSAIV